MQEIFHYEIFWISSFFCMRVYMLPAGVFCYYSGDIIVFQHVNEDIVSEMCLTTNCACKI